MFNVDVQFIFSFRFPTLPAVCPAAFQLINPIGPVEPWKPAAPSEPVAPVGPLMPVAPIDPTSPVGPAFNKKTKWILGINDAFFDKFHYSML